MTTVTRSLSRNRAILFGYLLVVVLAIAGEIVSSGFLRINHIDELIITGGFIALVGVGQTFVILTGGVDLSIPWVLNTSAVFLTLWAKGDSAKMAWIVPVLLGGAAVIGAVNGIGVAFLRIPPIIMTLGMSSVVEGGLLLVTNGGSGQNAPGAAVYLATHRWGPVPVLAVLWLAVLVAATVILAATPFGRRLYATGLNRRVAAFAGVNIQLVTVAVYVISGIAAALAGIALAGYVGQSYLGMGNPYLFASVAAVAIGGTSILGGSGNFVGTTAGALALAVLAALLPILGLQPAALEIVYGCVILGAVALSSARKGQSDRTDLAAAPAVTFPERSARKVRFMSMRLGSPRFWSNAFGALAVLSFAAAIPLSVLSGQAANLVIAGVIGLPSAGIGVLITRRQPGNPLGWLFLVSAVCQFIGTDGGGYALLAYHFGHHLPLASVAVALDQIWGPSLVAFAVSILLFPDGRLSRFWRWVLRVYAVAFATLLAATAVAIAGALAAHPVRVDENGGLAAVDNPVGWFNAVQFLILVLILGLSLSFIVRQALSWRRATGERRQQLKWLASGAFVSVVSLIVGGNFGSSGNGPTGPTFWGVLTSLVWFGVAALPVSIGVAILKYRLYEIDRIISRTLAYAIITGLLVGVYAGLVLLAQQVLKFSSPVAVAASTLVAAALFNPVRRRVQHAVDRRFNRARYDAERMVTGFAARLQDSVDSDAVRADLATMVHNALEPTHVSVWLRQ